MKKDYSKILLNKVMATKIGRRIPDKVALKMQYRVIMKQKLSLKKPRTFNEKIQWLKLNNRDPIYTKMADKHEVKKLIADYIGEQYVIPTIAGPFEHFDEIDFEKLPDQFVIKCTHDSAGLVICRDKKMLDKEAARKKIEASLNNNFYWRFREWVYKDIKPRIIVEKYMEDTTGKNANKSLVDYKFFTFSGESKFLYISEGLEDHATAHISFFDLKGNILPFKRLDYAGFKKPPIMPTRLDEMAEIANKLAQKVGAPFLRVDLYEINGQIYFSELTFYPNGGLIPFDPIEYDRKIGDMLELNTIS